MASAKITLFGLDEYTDGAIWDGLNLPSYFDRDVVINTILWKCGEYECICPDPTMLTKLIRLWSLKNSRFFARLAAAMQENYKPLANYDRFEEFEDHATGSGTTTGNSTNSESGSGRTGRQGDTQDTTTNRVSAFNASEFQNRDESISSGTESEDVTTNESRSAESNTKASSTDKQDSTHSGHMWGNIGVTTTQAILLEEIRVSAISPYELIADIFSNEFSVKVYI